MDVTSDVGEGLAPLPHIPTRDELHLAYVVEGGSLRELGAAFGVSYQTVRRWLDAAGIERRQAGSQKGKPHRITDDHRQKLRENIAKARSKLTPEAHARAGAKRRGQSAWNKGVPLSDEHKRKLREQRSTDEYRRKMSAALRRKPNPRAKASPRSDELLHGWEWRERRMECYARDGWLCRDCGVKCLGGKDARREPHRRIQAHHIVRRRDGGLDDLDNLVTLCLRCHTIRERRSDGMLFA